MRMYVDQFTCGEKTHLTIGLWLCCRLNHEATDCCLNVIENYIKVGRKNEVWAA